MKNLKNLLLLWIVVLSLLNITKADILPENSHSFKRCVQIENPNKVEWFKLIVRIDTVAWNNEVYQVNEDTCLKQHYKFWTSTPYLVQEDIDIEEINNILKKTKNPQDDLENNLWDIFTRFDAVNPNWWYISNKSNKTYENITYKLTFSKKEYSLVVTNFESDDTNYWDEPVTLMWYTTKINNEDEKTIEEIVESLLENIPNNNDDPQEILDNWYTREFNNAYDFAYENWITTMKSIDQANMNWKLYRIAMAKMLSQYAINILGKKPNTTKTCDFPDVSNNLDKSYDYWVTLACQLWIMGVNIKNFRPNDIVTRAEFATALSRLLYWTSDWKDKYYSTHLEVLSNKWIINDTNPNLQEKRWYVMIMLMRSK